MNKIKYIGILLAFIVLNASCCDDECDDCPKSEPKEGLLGNWSWVKSIGGFGTGILTPESEGYTKNIVLDDFYYSEFQDGSKLLEIQYDLQLRLDTFLGKNTYLVLDTGFEFTFSQKMDTLVLTEVCFDCYEHTYIRE